MGEEELDSLRGFYQVGFKGLIRLVINIKIRLDQAPQKGGLIVAFISGWEKMRDGMK